MCVCIYIKVLQKLMVHMLSVCLIKEAIWVVFDSSVHVVVLLCIVKY